MVLKFTARQGQYIKSLPLHHSQTIIEDSKEALTIQLKVHITYDFIMELLCFGAAVKVLEPASLVSELKGCYARGMGQYE